jgi:vacuolar-type H+-ATPase subunit C/Vma6
MEITQTTLEEMLLRGGYHSPQEIAEAYRTKKLAAVLGERNGFEEVSSALEEGIETGSFLRYQKESDVVMLELLERAAASIFSPGPLVAYVLRRELEASHLKLLTAGKTAGIDPGRLMARIPRG